MTAIPEDLLKDLQTLRRKPDGDHYTPDIRRMAQRAGLVWRPHIMAPVDAEQARAVLDLIEALEDDDDVQTVTTNLEASDEIMEKLMAAG
jgi:hypothetical protein